MTDEMIRALAKEQALTAERDGMQIQRDAFASAAHTLVMERDAALAREARLREALERAERVCNSIWAAGMIPVSDVEAHERASAETTEALIVWQAVRSGAAALPPEAREMLFDINARAAFASEAPT